MAKTKYVWDPVNDSYLMETDESGDATAVYTNEPTLYGNLVSQRRGNATNWYHYDAIGSTRELTNSGETVTDANLYDAWGVGVASSGSTENNFRFVGEKSFYSDPNLASYYVRARYLDSSVGRWISADPMNYIDGPNLFAYAHNSPINLRDVTGFASWLKEAYCIALAASFSGSATACSLGKVPLCCAAVIALHAYMTDVDCFGRIPKGNDATIVKCLNAARVGCLLAAPLLPNLGLIKRALKAISGR